LFYYYTTNAGSSFAGEIFERLSKQRLNVVQAENSVARKGTSDNLLKCSKEVRNVSKRAAGRQLIGNIMGSQIYGKLEQRKSGKKIENCCEAELIR